MKPVVGLTICAVWCSFVLAAPAHFNARNQIGLAQQPVEHSLSSSSSTPEYESDEARQERAEREVAALLGEFDDPPPHAELAAPGHFNAWEYDAAMHASDRSQNDWNRLAQQYLSRGEEFEWAAHGLPARVGFGATHEAPAGQAAQGHLNAQQQQQYGSMYAVHPHHSDASSHAVYPYQNALSQHTAQAMPYPYVMNQHASHPYQTDLNQKAFHPYQNDLNQHIGQAVPAYYDAQQQYNSMPASHWYPHAPPQLDDQAAMHPHAMNEQSALYQNVLTHPVELHSYAPNEPDEQAALFPFGSNEPLAQEIPAAAAVVVVVPEANAGERAGAAPAMASRQRGLQYTKFAQRPKTVLRKQTTNGKSRVLPLLGNMAGERETHDVALDRSSLPVPIHRTEQNHVIAKLEPLDETDLSKVQEDCGSPQLDDDEEHKMSNIEADSDSLQLDDDEEPEVSTSEADSGGVQLDDDEEHEVSNVEEKQDDTLDEGEEQKTSDIDVADGSRLIVADDEDLVVHQQPKEDQEEVDEKILVERSSAGMTVEKTSPSPVVRSPRTRRKDRRRKNDAAPVNETTGQDEAFLSIPKLVAFEPVALDASQGTAEREETIEDETRLDASVGSSDEPAPVTTTPPPPPDQPFLEHATLEHDESLDDATEITEVEAISESHLEEEQEDKEDDAVEPQTIAKKKKKKRAKKKSNKGKNKAHEVVASDVNAANPASDSASISVSIPASVNALSLESVQPKSIQSSSDLRKTLDDIMVDLQQKCFASILTLRDLNKLSADAFEVADVEAAIAFAKKLATRFGKIEDRSSSYISHLSKEDAISFEEQKRLLESMFRVMKSFFDKVNEKVQVLKDVDKAVEVFRSLQIPSEMQAAVEKYGKLIPQIFFLDVLSSEATLDQILKGAPSDIQDSIKSAALTAIKLVTTDPEKDDDSLYIDETSPELSIWPQNDEEWDEVLFDYASLFDLLDGVLETVLPATFLLMERLLSACFKIVNRDEAGVLKEDEKRVAAAWSATDALILGRGAAEAFKMMLDYQWLRRETALRERGKGTRWQWWPQTPDEKAYTALVLLAATDEVLEQKVTIGVRVVHAKAMVQAQVLQALVAELRDRLERGYDETLFDSIVTIALDLSVI